MASADRVSAPGRYSGWTERLHDAWQRTSFYVEARDHVKLAMDLYRPVSSGEMVTDPYPVVWVHTPYQRGVPGPGGTVMLAGSPYADPA